MPYWLRVFSLWFIIMLLQAFNWSRFNLESFMGQLMFITYPFLLVQIFKEKTFRYFSNIVVFFTIISFFLFIPSFISKEIHQIIFSFGKTLGLDVFHPWKTSFLIYTCEPLFTGEILRNASMFSEPGNYACHIGLALSFNLFYYNNLFTKKNLILILGMLTTFSTAGYIILYFIIAYYYFILHKTKDLKTIFLFIIFAFAIVYSFTKLEFMSEKIENYYEREENTDEKVKGRFGAAIKNLQEIKEHPIIGRGLLIQTRFDGEDEWKKGEKPWQNLNSWTNYLVQLGIPGFILFMIWYINSIKKFVEKENKSIKFVFLIFGSIFIGLSSQAILVTPPFLSILYLGYYYKINQSSFHILK
ncbi:MAG: O-antigen ligase family protein [Bacteroidales bacterium]|nr:O-antigen ligase family protein [Bacteroidales bacterium]